MLRKLLILLIFFISLLTILHIGNTIPHALAASGTLGAYPTNYDPSNPKTKSWFIYDLKPGESKQDSITVVNDSDNPAKVKIYPVDATTTSDGAFALLNEDQRQTDIGSWVSMPNAILTVGPHDRVQVPFTITIPKFATVGDHAGGIIVQDATPPSSSAQGFGINIVSRIGTRIYETVPGARVVSLDISNLTYKIANDHLVFSFTMTNNGNVILTPTGSIDVKDFSGKVVETIPLDSLGSVFPNKPTTVTEQSKTSAPWFGQYSATVTVNYSPIKAIAKSLTFFIYIKDWRATLPVPALLLLIAVFFIVRKLFFHAHRLRKLVAIQAASVNEKATKMKASASAKVKETMEKLSTTVQPAPAYAPAYAENVDEMFIGRHIKLLVVLTSISIIVLSGFFALLLQQLVLTRALSAQNVAAQHETTIALTPTPTVQPTPTTTPVNKSDMKVIVLNGSDKAGAARTIAQNLIKAGFSVISTDNAASTSAQTTISYPTGELDGANQLIEALQPDYANVVLQEADTTTFTITLGQ